LARAEVYIKMKNCQIRAYRKTYHFVESLEPHFETLALLR
jgi:hypothetical protein